jgi:hypothetical protein
VNSVARMQMVRPMQLRCVAATPGLGSRLRLIAAAGLQRYQGVLKLHLRSFGAVISAQIQLRAMHFLVVNGKYPKNSYLGASMTLKTSSSRVLSMQKRKLGSGHELQTSSSRGAQRRGDLRLPLIIDYLRPLTRGNPRLPRRFAPRNDEITRSSRINNLRTGFSTSRAYANNAYLGSTINLKTSSGLELQTSSSRGAQRRGDLRLPLIIDYLRPLTRGNRRLPRRFAPRNDENLGSSRINNLRHGFVETSAFATTQFSPEGMSADVSSHVLRTWSRRFAPRNDEIGGSSRINSLRHGFVETSAFATTQFSPEGKSADVSIHVLRTWRQSFAPRNDENLGSSKINNLRMGFITGRAYANNAYLGSTMTLKTSSSRGAQRRGDLRLPLLIDSDPGEYLRLLTRGNRRLPRRFAPRNDEIGGSSKINRLRHGFVETSAFATTQFSPEGKSADVSSHVLRTWWQSFAPRNDENLGSSKINNLRVNDENLGSSKINVLRHAFTGRRTATRPQATIFKQNQTLTSELQRRKPSDIATTDARTKISQLISAAARNHTSVTTVPQRNTLNRYGSPSHQPHFIRELATSAPVQARLQQTLTQQLDQRLRQSARESEQKMQTQLVQHIHHNGETREQLRLLVSESMLAPKLLQTLTDRLYHALEKRAAVERYRKGAY